MGEQQFDQAKFWNRTAKSYAKSPVSNPEAYAHKLAETAKRMTPDMRVLEFGCGTGTTALHHTHRVKHIDAIDYSSAMIEIARQKAVDAGIGNVTFETADILTRPRRDEPYDMVMAHSVLHLCPDLDPVLNKVKENLRPDGLFISSTACIPEISRFLPWILPIGALTGRIPKVNCFTGDELESVLRSHGFAIEYRWRPKPTAALFLIARYQSA